MVRYWFVKSWYKVIFMPFSYKIFLENSHENSHENFHKIPTKCLLTFRQNSYKIFTQSLSQKLYKIRDISQKLYRVWASLHKNFHKIFLLSVNNILLSAHF